MQFYDFNAGYRVGNYCPPPGASALDVLMHEINELGNEDFRSDFENSGLSREQLSKLSALDVIWVCHSRKDTGQYNGHGGLSSYEIKDLRGCAIICGNDDEGYLVVMPSGMRQLGFEIKNSRQIDRKKAP